MQDNNDDTTINLKYSQARNLFLSRDYASAETLLESLLNECPEMSDKNFLEIQKLLGTLYIRTKQFDKSLLVWKKVTERFPGNLEAIINLATVYRNLKQYDKAIQTLKEAKEIAGENDEVLFNLGAVYKDSGDYQNAIDAFQKLVALKSDDALAYNYLGTAYLLSGDKANASYYYKRGLQVDPNHPFLNYNLANIYREERAFTEALAFYNAALRVNPNWSDVLHSIAEIYTEEGNINAAINFEKSIIKTEGETERACIALANLYLKLNDEAEVERYYKKALALNPKSEQAAIGLCKYLIAKNEITETLHVLENAKKAGSESEELLLLYANTCLRVKDFSTAKEITQKLYQNNKDSIEVLKLYGNLFSLLGQTENAEKIFLQILQKSPGEIGLRFNLANQYYEAGNYKNAATQLEQYLIEKPLDSEARILLGKCDEKLKLFDKVRKEYETVLKDDPKNLKAMAALSEFLQKQGNVLDAVMMADSMINLQSERGSEDDLQSLAKSLNLYEKAAEKFNAQASNKPNCIKQNAEPVKKTESAKSDTHSTVEEEQESFSLIDESGKVEQPDDLNMPFDDLVELSDEEETWKKSNPIEEQTLKDIVDVDSPIIGNAGHDEIIPGLNSVNRDAAFSNPINQGGISPMQFAKANDFSNPDDFVLPQVQDEPAFMPKANDTRTLPETEMHGINQLDDLNLKSNEELEKQKQNQKPDQNQNYATHNDDALQRAQEQLAEQSELIENLNEQLANFKPPRDDAYDRNLQDELAKQSELIENLNEQLANFKPPRDDAYDRNTEDELAKQSALIDKLNEKLDNLKLSEYNDEQKKASERFERQNELLDKLNDKLAALDLPVYGDEASRVDEPSRVEERFEQQDNLIDQLNKKLDELQSTEYANQQKSDVLFDKQNALLEQQLEQLDDLKDAFDAFDDILAIGKNKKQELETPKTIEQALGDDAYDLMPATQNAGQSTNAPVKKMPVGKLKETPGFDRALQTISSEDMLELFKSLRELLTALPVEESRKFLASDERLKIQYIIRKLTGAVGLRMRAIFMKMRNFFQNPKVADIESDVTVKNLLEYLRDMADVLPDKGFSEACVSKLDSIIKNMK